MCGIIGQVSFDVYNPPPPLLNLLHHRGPDGSGEWINTKGNIYLGHTRLAILEPTLAGHQPMTDTSNRFTITFNGEIYNHLELRALLPSVAWRGLSDTETLIELLSAKGLGALIFLKGMFAFALHDKLDDSLLLVRDRLGIKPLWIKQQIGVIRFSSEIRALLEHSEYYFNTRTISEYIGFGRIPREGEIVKGIDSISPGGWLKINEKGIVTKGVWWPVEKGSTLRPKNHNEAAQQVRQLVTTAVEEHLISDVGVGAFLSGGIDSSIVTLVAGKILGTRLHTFTIGFPQKSFDEREIARVVAKKAGSTHTEIELKPETCLHWVKEAVTSLDLPSVDAINTFIVSKAVRDAKVKVALSGLGGDELFGGYPSFQNVPYINLLNFFPTNIRSQLIHFLPGKISEKLGGISDFNVSTLTTARRRFTSIDNLKAMGFENGTPLIPPAPHSLDMMGWISWAEIHGYMIPMLLRDSDQMSMAVGLEIRVPFLDHHLVEGILSLPQKFKKGKGVKPLLVKAFLKDLPREVYNRRKQGFTLPMSEWLEDPLSDFLQDGIFAAADFLTLQEPLNLLKKFKSGELHWTRVWKWAVLGHWFARQAKLENALNYSIQQNENS